LLHISMDYKSTLKGNNKLFAAFATNYSHSTSLIFIVHLYEYKRGLLLLLNYLWAFSECFVFDIRMHIVSDISKYLYSFGCLLLFPSTYVSVTQPNFLKQKLNKLCTMFNGKSIHNSISIFNVAVYLSIFYHPKLYETNYFKFLMHIVNGN
jgi:hypothetical protein